MGLFIIQSIIAVWVGSAAFYLLLTGKINKSIDVRKNKKKMKTLKQIQMETKIKYEPKRQRKLPIYLTQIERHESAKSASEVLGIIAVMIIVGIAVALAVILGA